MNSAWLGGLVVAAFLLSIAGLFHHYGVRLVAAEAWLAKGAWLVDVDTAADFALHHPPGALGLPLEDLALRAHELGARDRLVVVFSSSWLRAARAVREMRTIGFENVMNGAGQRAHKTPRTPPMPSGSAPRARDDVTR